MNYDGDSDGWYNRTSFDTPAPLGKWDNRTFIPSSQVIQPGIGNLPFTNWMEYDNQTRPDLNDSDGDSKSFITETLNGEVTAHYQDFNLSDGREVSSMVQTRRIMIQMATCSLIGTNTPKPGMKLMTIILQISKLR